MKVLLVDDEIFTIRMLQNLIHWKELGLELMGYAQNGLEAYEKVLKEPPDIIVSDIKMPGIDGLEFLKKVNGLSRGIKTILMSAYADFSYAREAMKLGSSDYILKPIDESELEQALRKVVNKIQGEKKQKKVVSKSVKQLDIINLYQYMRTGHGLNKILKSEQKYWSSMQKYSVFMVQINNRTIDEYDSSTNMEMIQEGYGSRILENTLSTYSMEHIIFDFEEGCWTLILEDVEHIKPEDVAKGIISKMVKELGFHVNICFSSQGSRLEELPGLYNEVKNLSKYSFYIEETDILGYEYNCNKRELDEMRYIGIIKDIDQAISDRDIESIQKILNEAFEVSPEYYPEALKTIYELCYQTVLAVRKYMSEEERNTEFYNELCEITYEKLAAIPSLQKLKAKILEIIGQMSEVSEKKSSKSYSDPVKECIALIEERYNQNLSLEEICTEIAVSKSYFCYLFKRETGMTVWNYLTVYRLQNAKKLLEKTELRSYEIAFKVGYNNPSYFSKLFKKYENMTPNEYRESKK